MTDFVEIDFIEAGDCDSGDAIAIRRRYGGSDYVYVVDGGYAGDGQRLVNHVRNYYGQSYFINHLVLTHPDADHASGLETVLKEIRVACLWMNRPWRHVDNLMPLFKNYQDRDRLITRLRNAFPKVAELESIAVGKGIEIRDAFQGDTIGEFTVLAPHRASYLRLVVESDKTPVPRTRSIGRFLEAVSAADWGEENLKGDSEGTSAENETSVVQFADLCGKKILLAGDAGVQALTEAHRAAIQMRMSTAPLDWFQVPHHGSRRNLSSEVLNKWLEAKLPGPVDDTAMHAIISANRNDKEHPKKAVVRALIHRGRRVFQTAGTLHCHSSGAPDRGWTSAVPLEYPLDQED